MWDVKVPILYSWLKGKSSIYILNCQQELISKVMAEYLTDFDNLEEPSTATNHLGRFQCLLE